MASNSIAFSGKGGVGKTTCLVLFLKFLVESKKESKKLVIDADPDANVADQLGINLEFRDTIAGKMQGVMRKIETNNIFPYDTNKQAIEAELFNSIHHVNSFDLLEMGRQEGEGCYCSVNNVLKNTIDIISENYDFVLFDSPAGLEHFARKTGKNVKNLLIVVDPSKMAFHTLERILVISKELSLNFNQYWVLGNRFSFNNQEFLIRKLQELNEPELKLLGFIPEDIELTKYNLLSTNLLNLPNDNKAYVKAKELFKKLI
ncbi:MAG: AAA family ATPase [Candidatus Lokiarchaeota archaeon]|nr:AAA family ATPase [Candidatus Lokiarchaeota archaeon]MBD3341910.1 AAA family ATPase [Candidatus Lokiarchaeota archaeon]